MAQSSKTDQVRFLREARVERWEKAKRGRPKITGPRPWEERGISRRTYYRQLATKRVVK